MNHVDLEVIQQRIGYRFENTDLLRQAYVRRSYSEENGGENNEVLEFIGDKVLDLVVVKLLTEKYGFMLGDCEDFDEAEEFDEFVCEKDEAELTEIKKKLVQKKTLAQRINALGLSGYLITGNGDHSQNEHSVKEDLFEAIIGAAAIDSGWNMDELQTLVETMLVPDSVLDKPEEDYIALIQEWAAKKGSGTPQWEEHMKPPSYMINLIDNSKKEIRQKNFYCWLCIHKDLRRFFGRGYSKREARKDACFAAYDYLKRENLWFSIRDEIENPKKEDAINQLEILARRGYFSIPVYDFTESYDRDGNPVWHCVCRIKERKQTFSAESSSKKNAKKTSAFQMLKYVLETEA